jgi:hypothetical protein
MPARRQRAGQSFGGVLREGLYLNRDFTPARKEAHCVHTSGFAKERLIENWEMDRSSAVLEKECQEKTLRRWPEGGTGLGIQPRRSLPTLGFDRFAAPVRAASSFNAPTFVMTVRLRLSETVTTSVGFDATMVLSETRDL